MRRSCHNRSVKICVEPRNWLDCLFTFLFFAVSKKEGIAVEYFYCNHATFSMSWRCPKINFTGTVSKHNNQNILNSTQISKFNASIYTSIMTWSTHKWEILATQLAGQTLAAKWVESYWAWLASKRCKLSLPCLKTIKPHLSALSPAL